MHEWMGCHVRSAPTDVAKAWDNDTSTFATMSIRKSQSSGAKHTALYLDRNYTDVIGIAFYLHALASVNLKIYGQEDVVDWSTGKNVVIESVDLNTLGWWYSPTYDPPITVRGCSLPLSLST